jgi:hypothetical protein
MKRTFFSALCALLLTHTLAAQVPAYSWAFAAGNAANLMRSGEAIAVDASGNILTTGTFEGTIDLDPGPGTHLLTSAGNKDIYLAKLTPAGTLLWAFSISSGGEDLCTDLAVDNAGNLVLTGRFYGTADFDPGAGSLLLTSNSFPGSFDGFVAKYDANGNLQWAFHLGATLYITCEVSAVDVDAAGSIYITGNVMAGSVDFDPDPNSTFSIVGNPQAAFLAKYSAAGQFIFAGSISAMSASAAGKALAVSSSGKVALSGSLGGNVPVPMDPMGSSGATLSASNGRTFVAQYDTSGALTWAFNLPDFVDTNQAVTTTAVNDVAYDQQGNMIVCGSFPVQIDCDPGAGIANITAADNSYDYFAAKYSAAGNYVWAVAAGGAYSDRGNALSVDASDNIYITGSFADTMDVDPGAGTYDLVSSSNSAPDIFLIRYSPTAQLQWAFSLGSTTGWDDGRGITVNDDTIFVTGYFTGTADFDPSGATQNMSSFGGVQDAFVAKYVQDSTVSIHTYSSSEIVLYPNPASQTVCVDLPQSNTYSFTLSSITGETVLQQLHYGNRVELDVSTLTDGVYTFKITGESFCAQKKIVVMH